MLTKRKVEVWETSDGVMHSTHEMAEQHILNKEVCELFVHGTYDDPQDIVNVITGHRRVIRNLLDACDIMEKAILR